MNVDGAESPCSLSVALSASRAKKINLFYRMINGIRSKTRWIKFGVSMLILPTLFVVGSAMF